MFISQVSCKVLKSYSSCAKHLLMVTFIEILEKNILLKLQKGFEPGIFLHYSPAYINELIPVRHISYVSALAWGETECIITGEGEKPLFIFF